jgi:hypothetical protein
MRARARARVYKREREREREGGRETAREGTTVVANSKNCWMLHVAVRAVRQSVTPSLNFEGDSTFGGSSPFKGSLALGS